MAQYNEHPFETEICEHLAAHGWLYSPNSEGYDKERALWPEDVFGWLEDTQADALAKVLTPGSPGEAKQRAQLLDRLVKVLDTPTEAGGGTLNVLRGGFKQVSAKFTMARFRPETSLNPATTEQYAKMRVRVVRQVFYSTASKRSVDLVLFVNGLPVATLELKTDFTQSVTEAIEQYKKTRLPHDPATRHTEPLFVSGARALVHFAVSNDEVWMTTRLEGEKTHFLPFNLGYDGGAGNPPAAVVDGVGKSATAYLWEQVLARDSLLDIVGKFMHVEHKTNHDPITGAVSKSSTLLFPRYHQWEVVTALEAAARAEGPGHKYLVQHSAGSGKTNSIAWAAHRLARLHEADRKVFDSVIVVTDRTVLDDQLQDAISQIDGGTGVVVTVDHESVGKAGGDVRSKSGLLAKSLLDGRLIIVVTIQTFPHAMEAIRGTRGLAHKRFAVIADEAHSSQTGATANRLKEVLSADELAALDDGGDIDVEAVLAADATARASNENISYFAFTATPKAKTLELFGRPPVDDPAGLPVPFHVYTMKQAIQEGYILDVLPGYQTYKTAFEIAQSATGGKVVAAGAGQEPQADADLFGGDLVDESSAVKGLMRWVKLHPTNIAQKVQIIVEHFRSNVAGRLDGHAKAMVVTDSRKAAVRYKLAIDAYIADHGYAMKTLVAFSGEIEDPASGPEKFTETNMNPPLGAQGLAKAFAGPDYRVMLVANKFQTGFDQPLLCAMYVDKRLSGVTAVQTLSRLNRVYRTPSGVQKARPLVLDFVNDPEEIRASFEPYYTDAFLEVATDPNLVHDISTKLDQAGIFTPADVEAAAAVWVAGNVGAAKKGKSGKGGRSSKTGGNNALTAVMAPAKQRFKQRYSDALTGGGPHAEEEIEVLDLFRKDVSTFVRLYDFMSQIVDYGDVDLEKRAIFCRLLERLIRQDAWSAKVDLGDVTLVNIKQTDTGLHDLSLGERTGLSGAGGAGSGAKPEPHMVAFAEVIERLNDLFGDQEFSQAQKESFTEATLTVMAENQTLTTQAATNTGQQFAESPDLKDEFLSTLADKQGADNKMTDYFFGEGVAVDTLIQDFAKAFYERMRAEVKAGSVGGQG